MAEVTTPHYKIFEYWKTKRINRFGEITGNIKETEAVVEDWGEPCCWACGKPVKDVDKYKEYDAWLAANDYQKIWSNKIVGGSLQRCHIIPGSLGGKDESGNLFLLCRECHMLSPDTTNPEGFYRWVYWRRREKTMGVSMPETFLTKVDTELSKLGLPSTKEILRLVALFGTKDQKEKWIYQENGMIEYMRANIGLHLTYIAESTWVSAVTDWYVKMYNDIKPRLV